MAELGGRLVQGASLQRRPPFRDIQAGILGPIVSRDQLASLQERRRRFLFPAGARQREPELVVRFPALRLQPRRFLQLGDRVGHVAVTQLRLAEREMRPRERGRQLDDFSQLRDLLRQALGRAGAVGDRQVELGVQRRRGPGRPRARAREPPPRRRSA